ncbi:hypothetical protein [Streptomyces sp. NPDC005438]|uniref:hypothetical protein n=1 Tax=Streptomyces sp. NPDC005438 TaxID=3156880 RepID=UPI0033BB6904
MTRVGAIRLALGSACALELGLLATSAAGVAVPPPAYTVALALLGTVLAAEGWLVLRLFLAHRADGASLRVALGRTVTSLVPTVPRRLLVHELRLLHSLLLWVGRRRHGVGPGDHTAGYTGPQTPTLQGLLFVSVVETVALAVLIPWPLVHVVVLVLDLYGVLFLLGLHASCVVRPHLVTPDGALRVRYGALFDLWVPAEAVASVRVHRRYPSGRSLRLDADGTLDLVVGGHTTVTVELREPVECVRPLGRRQWVRRIHLHADDPGALVEARRRTSGEATAG